MNRATAALLATLLFVAPATAHDEGVGTDPAIALFPEPSVVAAAVDEAGRHPHATLHTVGASQDGIPIRLVEYILPGAPVSERTVSFIMTQQHGNEPAGTPAALDLFDRIASGEFDAVLANQVLLVLPQANPDGSLDNRRTAEDNTDINRDHVALVTSEAQALHEVLNRWDVHLAFDHHEYGGVGLGAPVPVRVYDWDITTMLPNHGNVRTPTTELAASLNYDHIYPYVQSQGYSIGDYGVTGVGVSGGPTGNVFVPLQQTAGGPDPGILRNNFGLNNVVGLLVETFIAATETPTQSFERRVGAHTAVMEAVLQYGHEESDALRSAKRASEKLNREQPMTEYVEGDTRGPLARWYEIEGGLDPLMQRHGLPMALGPANGYDHLYDLQHERTGLLAAILHPDSSRGFGATALAHDPHLDSIPNEPESRGSPMGGLLAIAAVGILAGLFRRYSNND